MSPQLIVPALLILAVSFVLLTGFCVYGYRSLMKQFDQLVFDGEKVASLSENLIEAAKQFEKFRSQESERRENAQPEVFAPPAPASSSSRSQVLRLHRSGESIPSIASALGVSQGEVKLMVKVQELLSANGGENSPSFI